MVTQSRQTTYGTAYNFSYTYNNVGKLETETYPSGRVLTLTYDHAGRSNVLTGLKSGITTTYAQNLSYLPHGAVYDRRLSGGTLKELQNFTTDLQLSQKALYLVSTNTLRWQVALGYGSSNTSNGNVTSQVMYPLNATQQYTYDGVNRLNWMQETGSTTWAQQYGYDQYGNRWVPTSVNYPLDPHTPTVQTQIAAATNRLSMTGVSYDNAGNQTQIGGYTAIYDGENKQTTIQTALGQATYMYDGEGRRIRKLTPQETVTYVYNAFGRVVAEYGGSVSSTGTKYLTTDHLGGTRAISSAAGALLRCYDYLPFGELIPNTINGRNALACYTSGQDERLKFTSKERDGESNLDYFLARYYSGVQGRFTSPDEFSGGPDDVHSLADTGDPLFYANPVNPQSLNKYQYCYNNPTRYVDPDGHVAETIWDAANVGMGLYSLYTNIKGGNYVSAAIDVAGVVVDSAAMAAPFVPGGIASVIKAARAGDKAVDGVKITSKADDVVDTIQTVDKVANNASRGETAATIAGRQAHKNYCPGPGFKKEVLLPSGKRADAVNFETKTVKELKPNNPRGIKRGKKQVEEYRKELENKWGGTWTSKVDTY